MYLKLYFSASAFLDFFDNHPHHAI